MADLEKNGEKDMEALQASERQYRRLFESAKDGILILNSANAKIEDVNPFLVDLLGYSREELIGKEIWEVGPFRDVAASITDFRELQAKEYIRYEDLPLQKRDGRLVSVEFVSNVYEVNGGNVIQCNIRDITVRKQAEERIRILTQELEARVIERTSELQAVVDALEAEMIERRRLGRAILEISEHEQSRVGQELHDGLCQTLAGIGFLAKALKRNLEEKALSGEAAKADTIANLLKDATNEARGLAARMYPVNIEEYGLAAGLEKLAADTAKRFQIVCEFKCRVPVVITDNRVAAHVYRITQEAISNAIKDGMAKWVLITLETEGKQVRLKIENNGEGLLEGMKPAGMGLKTMDYRARSIGGSIEVRERSRGGVEVICSFPNQQRMEHENRTLETAIPCH
jgi:PAS domain S-box-containing protein